jgi:DNA-binding transcriptional LysR family regulator
MFDWDDLRFLLAVHNSGSASAAARALRVDKATVSRRIAALERAVGVRLLDRRVSGWSPTAPGRRVIAAANAVDARLAALLADLGDGPLGPRARVRFTAPQWFCTEVLLPALGGLHAAAPWLDLDITAGSRVVNLAEREAEVGLRNRRPPRGEFVVRKAGELGSALYASKAYLAERAALRTRDDLRGQRAIGYPDALTYVPDFLWLNAMADRLGPVLRVDDAQALAAAIRSGLGVGVVPCLLGDRDGTLVRLLGEHHRETIWLVAPIELARTRAVRAVLSFVAALFHDNARALSGAV